MSWKEREWMDSSALGVDVCDEGGNEEVEEEGKA
jgi:hypothetical protein